MLGANLVGFQASSLPLFIIDARTLLVAIANNMIHRPTLIPVTLSQHAREYVATNPHQKASMPADTFVTSALFRLVLMWTRWMLHERIPA